MSLTQFKLEFSKKNNQKIATLRVGALENKLDDIVSEILPKFDHNPQLHKEIHRDHYGNIDVTLIGSVRGIPYLVELEYVACPVPFDMVEIHHALITMSQGPKDEITPVIARKFRAYETEIREQLKKAEETIRKNNPVYDE